MFSLILFGGGIGVNGSWESNVESVAKAFPPVPAPRQPVRHTRVDNEGN